VRAFLTTSGEREPPPGWWCGPPAVGADPIVESEGVEEGGGGTSAPQPQQQQQQQQQQQHKARKAKPQGGTRLGSSGGAPDSDSDFESEEDYARRRRGAGGSGKRTSSGGSGRQQQAGKQRARPPDGKVGAEDEQELQAYLAARAAEAPAWARAFGRDGRPMALDDDDDDEEEEEEEEEKEEAKGDAVATTFDEEEEFVAAAAAAAAVNVKRPRTAGGTGAWAHAVGAPTRATPVRRHTAGAAAAPLTPFDAARFAEMAGLGGAVASTPGAAAVDELPGLDALQRAMLRALVLRQARGAARPSAGAAAAVHAAFPGGKSSVLAAALARPAAVAEAATALTQSFRPSPTKGRASDAGGGDGGSGAKQRKRPPLPRTLPGPNVPPHLAADGPTVRVGDPDGPKFEMLRRNVYLCKDRPRRMGHDDISVCCCRRAGPRRPQASRHGLRGPRIDAALALGGRAAGPCCAPCRGCTGPAS
jgi:hypothetical protein